MSAIAGERKVRTILAFPFPFDGFAEYDRIRAASAPFGLLIDVLLRSEVGPLESRGHLFRRSFSLLRKTGNNDYAYKVAITVVAVSSK